MKLRGVALVDAVMDRRVKDGEELSGRPAGEVASLRLGDKPLSPALQRWLERDDEMFELGEPEPFTELVEREFGDMWVEAFAPMAELLSAPCVLFEGWGSDSRRFLYLGETDRHGEYSVITIDFDDGPYGCINGPVDVWLAQHAGFLADESVYGEVPPEYEADRQEHAKLNFGGYLAYGDGRLARTLDLFEEDDEQ